MNGEEELNNLLAAASEQPGEPVPVESSSAPIPVATFDGTVQWHIDPNDRFRASGPTTRVLPAGAYSIGNLVNGELFFERVRIVTDNLVELPDSANTQVLRGIQKFWASQEHYRRFGLLFKRGVLLWGPPGGGKTVTVTLLVRDLISRNGVVLFCVFPAYLIEGLRILRRIEPERPIIVVFEDLDEIIAQWGQHLVLSVLDGENRVTNVVHIATTNHPERLGARILNRPSRFDERIKVGLPSLESRLLYLEQVAGNHVDMATLRQWGTDTEGLTVAHLRELVAAVLCLGHPYAEALARLHAMTKRIKGEEEFRQNRIGLV